MKPGSFRTYPLNSPQAAARILAAALLANGDIKPAEWQRLADTNAIERLGLQGLAWDAVIDDLCEDLMNGADLGPDRVAVDPPLEAWLREVDDARLQALVLELCVAVIEADGEVHPRESLVLRAAMDHWALPAEQQARAEPLVHGLDFQVVPRRWASKPA